MLLRLILTILAALLLTACDRPAISEEEAIANVQASMRYLYAWQDDGTAQSCYTLVGSAWDEATADYKGNGRWRVEADAFTWDYFERTDEILSVSNYRNC